MFSKKWEIFLAFRVRLHQTSWEHSVDKARKGHITNVFLKLNDVRRRRLHFKIRSTAYDEYHHQDHSVRFGRNHDWWHRLWITLYVGKRCNSGGGYINVYCKRGKALECIIPFSLCDGTTPFWLFISKESSSRKAAASEPEPEPVAQIDSSSDIHRLFLSNRTGYVTIPLFKCIVDEFSKWWNKLHKSLNCYLVCNNLSVHGSKMTKYYANARCIYIFPIMAGSSHWFQVHDQLPFGSLKKKLS